jgi:hypothetical protein
VSFVMRLPGHRYEDGQEFIDDCYLTKDGGATVDLRRAQRYASAAEAWDHFWASDQRLEDIDCPVKSRVEQVAE